MQTIKNLKRIKFHISDDAVDSLNILADANYRCYGVEFKILKYEDGVATIQALQSKKKDKSLSVAELVSMAKKMFLSMEGLKIHVHPVCFIESVVETVDPSWIKVQMQSKKVKLKDIVFDSGIDKTCLSAIINNHVGLSQPMKAFFYYYFLNQTER